MKKSMCIFVILGLLLIGACFGVSQSIADEAWLDENYEEYLAEPESYSVCEAEVVDYFSFYDSVFTGWHYFTVVEFDNNGRAQRVAMPRDVKADKTGTRLTIAVAKDYHYDVNNAQTANEDIPQLANAYAACVRLAPTTNHTNRNMYILVAVLSAAAAAVSVILLKKGILS